jgi:hypothetical protein
MAAVNLKSLDDHAGDFTCHGCASGTHFGNGAQEFLWGGTFEQVSASPRFERLEKQIAITVNRYDNYLERRHQALEPGGAGVKVSVLP